MALIRGRRVFEKIRYIYCTLKGVNIYIIIIIIFNKKGEIVRNIKILETYLEVYGVYCMFIYAEGK